MPRKLAPRTWKRRSGALEERALLVRCRERGDAAARDELIERLLPFVRHIARGYLDRGEPLEDLVQVGSIGLMNAVDRFDLDRGRRLSTFAGPNISGEIKRHFRDRSWAIRAPRDLQELHAGVRQVTECFEEQQGRTPTLPEVCEATGREEGEVLEAIEAGRGYAASSLDVPSTADRSVLDALGADDAGYTRVEIRATLAAGLRTLPARERRIVLLRFVTGLSQREIAARVGLSQMHVSRILRRSLDRLQAAVG